MKMVKDSANWAEALGAKWTPEVFVLDARDSVVYQGRSTIVTSPQGNASPEPNDVTSTLPFAIASLENRSQNLSPTPWGAPSKASDFGQVRIDPPEMCSLPHVNQT